MYREMKLKKTYFVNLTKTYNSYSCFFVRILSVVLAFYLNYNWELQMIDNIKCWIDYMKNRRPKLNTHIIVISNLGALITYLDI